MKHLMWVKNATDQKSESTHRWSEGHVKNERTFYSVTSSYTWFSLLFSVVKMGSYKRKTPTEKYRPFHVAVAREEGQSCGVGLPLLLSQVISREWDCQQNGFWANFPQVSCHLKCFLIQWKLKGEASVTFLESSMHRWFFKCSVKPSHSTSWNSKRNVGDPWETLQLNRQEGPSSPAQDMPHVEAHQAVPNIRKLLQHL